MNILLINHYAGSPEMGMEYRPYYLAKEWVNAGHEVTILAGSYSHVRTSQPAVKKDFEEQDKNGIRYCWIKTPVYQGNGVLRFLSMLIFVLKIMVRANSISKKYSPDIVIASSTYPLDNFPARKIARKNNAKYIYEVHDLWPLSPMELGEMSKNHPFIRIMQYAENFAYKNVDGVISMLPKTIEHMTNHGLQSNKWHYIPNGINLDEWKSAAKENTQTIKEIRAIKETGNQIVAYTGSIGLANALESFIDAAKLLQHKNITFIIVGNGPEKENLRSKVKNEKISNFKFFNAVPKTQIPYLLQQFDILYIGLQRQPLFRFGISPNKMLDYMMAGKPIIQAIDAGNNMVQEAGCGISIDPENPEKIAAGIEKILFFTEEERQTMGLKGKEYVIKNHDFKVLANKMIGIFRSN